MKCPLCKSHELQKIEDICARELQALYSKSFGIDTSTLITRNLQLIHCSNCQVRFFSPPITGDESFYSKLQQKKWYYEDTKSEFAYAKSYIKSTDAVLEVGCGKGAFSRQIECRQYIGLELSQSAKKKAELNGIRVLNERVENYAVDNEESFDIVCSFQVLEHVADIRGFIGAQINALKPGGKLIISVPNEDSFIKHSSNNVLNYPPHHVSRWNDASLKSVATLYKLDLVDIHTEQVQQTHKKWYWATRLKQLLLKDKLLGSSPVFMLANKCFFAIGFCLSPLLKISQSIPGHTITAVYRKPL